MFGELEEAVLLLKIKGEARAESFGRPSTCVNFSTMQEHKKALVRSDGNSEISHLTASSLAPNLAKEIETSTILCICASSLSRPLATAFGILLFDM